MRYLNYYFSLFFLIIALQLSSCRKYECPDLPVTIKLGSDEITDIHITSLNPNTPTGETFGINTAIAWTQDGVFFRNRTVFKFDYSKIPSGAKIKRAVLILYADTFHIAPIKGHNSDNLTGPNNWLIQKVTSSWDPTTVTWNNQPSTTALNEIQLPESASSNENAILSSSLVQSTPAIEYIAPYEGTSLPLSKKMTYVVDMTDFVKEEFENPSMANGFMMKLVSEAQYNSIVFASGEHPDSKLHPTLEIKYMK